MSYIQQSYYKLWPSGGGYGIGCACQNMSVLSFILKREMVCWPHEWHLMMANPRPYIHSLYLGQSCKAIEIYACSSVVGELAVHLIGREAATSKMWCRSVLKDWLGQWLINSSEINCNCICVHIFIKVYLKGIFTLYGSLT